MSANKSTKLLLLPLEMEKNLETVSLLKSLTQAHRYLAELKGMAKTIPNESILVATLGLQEAKDSSAIENILTTHDSLFRADIETTKIINRAEKEVKNYQQAMWQGYSMTRKNRLIRYQDILKIQAQIEPNKPDIRKLPGTVLANVVTGETIYTPPQHADEINRLLDNLISYINDDNFSDLDPLVKVAIIHHRFESIHPFYDGNGRCGRIINILYLVKTGLLDLPILYLSRYINKNKAEYYRLLQLVRDKQHWAQWVAYMIKGIEITAKDTLDFIQKIRDLMQLTKHELREKLPKIYSQVLLNLLFTHPYSKISFLQDQLHISRITATNYLNKLNQAGFVDKHKIGRTNFYINQPLVELMVSQED